MKIFPTNVTTRGNTVHLKDFITLDEAYKLAGFSTREGIYRAARSEKIRRFVMADGKLTVYLKSEIINLKKMRTK